MAPLARSGEPRDAQANTATIRKRAKRAIAREWARARGRGNRPARSSALDREAARWREEKDRTRLEAEEAAARLERFRVALRAALGEVDRPGQPAELLEPIAWIYGEEKTIGGGGNRFFVEPRDSRRFRRPRHPSVLYRLDLDKNQHLVDCFACSPEELASAKGE